MTELLTAVDLASLLKISKSKVYELTQERTRAGDLRINPLPCLKVGKSVRFQKDAVEAWLERLTNV